MESKHTPGPWVVDPDHPRDISPADDLRFGVASICNSDNLDGRWVFGEQSKANARLIAAAPELLAALQEAAEVFRTLAVDGPSRTARDIAASYDALIARATA